MGKNKFGELIFDRILDHELEKPLHFSGCNGIIYEYK